MAGEQQRRSQHVLVHSEVRACLRATETGIGWNSREKINKPDEQRPPSPDVLDAQHSASSPPPPLHTTTPMAVEEL